MMSISPEILLYLLKFIYSLISEEINKYTKVSSENPQYDIFNKAKECRTCRKEILFLFGCCMTCQNTMSNKSMCLDCCDVIYIAET